MSDHELRGPSVTYVTDETLSRMEQERVLRGFMACAEVHPLRVAFRLPLWTDAEVHSLLDWYWRELSRTGSSCSLQPPLVQDRPEATEAFPGTVLWLPWPNRDLVRVEDVGNVAISVQSVDQAHEAISVGASELIFGQIFSSESHPGQPGLGIASLVEVSESIQCYQVPPRLTAVGGIDQHTIPEMGRIHSSSVACVRTISQAVNIAETLDRIKIGWITARINADLEYNQRNPFGNPSNIFF